MNFCGLICNLADPFTTTGMMCLASQSPQRVRWPGCRGLAILCAISRGFGDNAANKVRHFWIVDLREGLTNVYAAVFLALWDASKVEGISIPFPQREVRIIGPRPVPVE